MPRGRHRNLSAFLPDDENYLFLLRGLQRALLIEGLKPEFCEDSEFYSLKGKSAN